MVAIEYTELGKGINRQSDLHRVRVYLQRQADGRKVSIEQGTLDDFFLN